MSDLHKLIARDQLRRDLMDGVNLDDGDDEGFVFALDDADDLMRRAAEDIDAMQDEINRLRAVEVSSQRNGA